MGLKEPIEKLEGLLRAVEPAMAAAHDWQGRGMSFWELVEALPKEASESVDASSEAMRSQALENAETVATRLRRLISQLQVLDATSQAPILAITGMLNAGKSSLLASFLSPSGRRRVLIGQANDQGTHRFVLWVPEAWRANEAIWQMVIGQLIAVFGTAPEPLADRLEDAARQYNGQPIASQETSIPSNTRQRVDPLTIPLIATDSMLDRWGLALLDCPDIQTGLWDREFQTLQDEPSHRTREVAERSADHASHRAAILAQAMQLSSAYLVVTTANGLHDQLIVDLLSGMQRHFPGIGRMLLINRVPRRYTSAEIAEEVRKGFASYTLQRTYMAYNFDGPLDRQRLPVLPVGLQTEAESDGELPVFFRVDLSPSPQPPEPIPEEHFLAKIGSQVDRGKLMLSCRASLVQQFHKQLEGAWSRIQIEAKGRQERLQRIWRILAEACYGFSQSAPDGTQAGPLRLHASHEIVLQLSDSLERTAPMWAKPGRKILRLAHSARERFGQVANRMNPAGWLTGKIGAAVEVAQSKFRKGENGKVVTADVLADLLLQADYRSDFPSTDGGNTLLRRSCQEVINRFQNESQSRLNESELDQYTSKIWSQMTWQQRFFAGVAPSALLFGPLVAVVTLPFDFGGSSVLVLASMKELLLAGGLGVGAGFGAGLMKWDSMPQLAEHHVAWQQLSDLFALGCDELAIPRPETSALPELQVAGRSVPLVPATIPVKSQVREGLIPPSFRSVDGFWNRIRDLVMQLEKETAE